MKYKLIAALFAVLFMFPFFNMAAYAAEPEELPPEEQPPAVVEETEPVPVAEYPGGVAWPFTPDGAGTVIDTATDADGKEFYTVMTPDEHVFYIVIDRQRGQENVYFLNAVTVADLMALAELPEAEPVPEPAPAPAEQPTAEPAPAPAPAPEPEQGGVSVVMYVVIAVLAVLGGAAGWYFKVYKPKQQGAASDTEYEPPIEEADADYSADAWGEDTDDNPPWDEDEESGAGE